MNSRIHAASPRLVVIFIAWSLPTVSGLGCSSEGTGSVNVKSPASVRAQLEKGMGPVASKQGATDEVGVKFRKGHSD